MDRQAGFVSSIPLSAVGAATAPTVSLNLRVCSSSCQPVTVCAMDGWLRTFYGPEPPPGNVGGGGVGRWVPRDVRNVACTIRPPACPPCQQYTQSRSTIAQTLHLPIGSVPLWNGGCLRHSRHSRIRKEYEIASAASLFYP